MKKIAFIVDSSSGIKNGDYKDVYVLPLSVTVTTKDKKISNFDDNVNITCKQICENMIQGNDVKTSQASPGGIIELLDSINDKYDQIFSIVIPKTISNSYNTWQMIGSDYPKLSILENYDVAHGVKWTIEDLLALAKKGKLDVDSAKAYMANAIKHRVALLYVYDINQLKKGGRVSNFAKSIAIGLLKLKPMILLDEKGLNFFKVCKSYKKGLDASFEGFAKKYGSFEPLNSIKRVCILNTPTYTSNKDVDECIEYLKTFISKDAEITTDELPGVICCHTGDKAFTFYFEVK